MNVWIALFRGINVGGRNLLRMQDLREHMKQCGARNVRTYIQSGNVVFFHESDDPGALGELIRKSIWDHSGFEPDVVVLSPEELKIAMEDNPFPEAESMPATLHLFFLLHGIQTPDLKSLERIRKNSEKFSLNDRVFYLHAPDGIGKSSLAARVESVLRTPATARNWRTLTAIRAIVE
ncbi:MAG TPA: DUF1697 domain-containing protein [Thermoanaerobaculia bacterium]|nr:DUF1697 domain-containing protein [Thermoanaerobaculia bacterium]HUM29239.1 DUF1697 domain-containing protein [Thermoanaerobaculia bacterium]HXK67802.1 DUF1697 domain-containing protein [Thermoanaerobaculia bacterium]